MPKDIVTGDDAESVAAYVASVASLPVRAQPGARPGARRAGGHGGRQGDLRRGRLRRLPHARRPADASGNVGPNLDDAKPSKELVIERVTNGKGVMPSFKG